MFATNMGVIKDDSNQVYLRPETAQGIFLNYKMIQRTSRLQLPFGIAQIGKSFRNEITPGNFIFRTREFEQMELEFFIKPADEQQYFDEYVTKSKTFLLAVGLDETKIVTRRHDDDELAHYASQTVDLEYQFLHGQGEL